MQKIETRGEFESLPVEQQDNIRRLIRNLMSINCVAKTLADSGISVPSNPILLNVIFSALTLSEMVDQHCLANLTADPSHELIILLMASQAKAMM